METISNSSTLEILPDEILLQVCKYLICSDILYSFMGLNDRLTRMIAQYRHRISFYKTAISKFDYLSMRILPEIGWQICSLHIDCCYSVLQDRLFLEYFGEKMPVIFPNLQRIRLSSYSHDQLVPLLHTLHDMNKLIEIRLYGLFSMDSQQQADFVRLLFQTNNHRLTNVLIDDASSVLCFHENDRYLNIVHLRIKLESMADLPVLFAAIPNVQCLDVIIEARDSNEKKNTVPYKSPLRHLTDFSLKSIAEIWDVTELEALMASLPNVRCLSLLLCIQGQYLLRGDVILSLLPPAVEQFHYVAYSFTVVTFNTSDEIAASWPSSHPIACFCDDHFCFLHTKPWYFSCLELPTAIGKSVSSAVVHGNGYEKRVGKVWLYIKKSFSLSTSLVVLSQCRRVRKIVLFLMDDTNTLEGMSINICEEENLSKVLCLGEKLSITQIKPLPHVVQIHLNGTVLSTTNYYSIILHALPNLFRLDLSFACLLRLFEDPSICSLLSQRILSLCIVENDVSSTASNISEEHLPLIASVFSRVGDIYFGINHLVSSSSKMSSEEEIISPSSCESFLLCLLKTFQKHSLFALCIDGKFNDEIKTNAEQWLRTNSILAGQRFAAVFDKELDRLLIWM